MLPPPALRDPMLYAHSSARRDIPAPAHPSFDRARAEKLPTHNRGKRGGKCQGKGGLGGKRCSDNNGPAPFFDSGWPSVASSENCVPRRCLSALGLPASRAAETAIRGRREAGADQARLMHGPPTAVPLPRYHRRRVFAMPASARHAVAGSELRRMSAHSRRGCPRVRAELYGKTWWDRVRLCAVQAFSRCTLGSQGWFPIRIFPTASLTQLLRRRGSFCDIMACNGLLCRP